MSNITDWIKYELYPSLFESIDRAFPEHDFKRYPGGWRSKTYLNSQPHKSRADKTVVTKAAPGLILEQGGEALGLVDYTMRSKGLEFIQAVEYLASVAGLQVPKGDFSQVKEERQKLEILEAAAGYLSWALENLEEAKDTRAYLAQRGYTMDEVKDMGLGYISSQGALSKRLQELGYTSQDIEAAMSLDSRIGNSHRLAIPYRSGGSVKGFKFRTTTGADPKYLNTTGLDKQGGFFNLLGIKGDKDVVIVEGELDALHATVKGVENVVATAGNSIASEQIKDAVRRGAKSFTLFYDLEPGKEEATAKQLKKAIEVILGEGVNRIYIVNLEESPEAKIDPDSLIRDKGIEAFTRLMREARPYYEYLLQLIVDKYDKVAQESGLEAKDKDNFLDEVVATGSRIPNPIDRDQYKAAFIDYPPIKPLGITAESLEITVERLKATRDREARDKRFKNLLEDANKLQLEGKVDKALELLDSKVKEVKLQDKAQEFSKLLLTTTEAKVREEEAQQPEALDIGYKINGYELLLPAGAISVFAAPTNHGKTVMLINSVLNAAAKYPDKRFIFFTYEEAANSILQYFINTYMDIDLNSSKTSNRRVIKSYFKSGDTQYISRENKLAFLTKKEEFFKTYIEPGRILIHYVDYNSDELGAAINYLHKQTDIGGIFIDYFQLLKLPRDSYKSYSSRVEELKQICISLKDVAVKTGLPLVLAAQFNREVTNLMRLHPTNIGEAGDIERIVNTLIGLWNIEKKTALKGVTDAEAQEINERIRGEETGMYLEILKSRDLPTGAYEALDFNGNTGRIKNPEKQPDLF